jgi:hypothetical protein
MTYGSAINRSVSFMIRFGNAILVEAEELCFNALVQGSYAIRW